MRRKLMMRFMVVILALILASSTFATVVSGITSNDLREIGVSENSIKMANDIVESAIKKSKVLSLEKKRKELEVQKLLIDNPEKNWEGISSLLEEIGSIESEMKKNKLKSQIELKKYITDEQYKNARELAIKRYKEDASVNIKIKSSNSQ
jgi:hypothetical protein